MMTKVRLGAFGVAYDEDTSGAMIRDIWREVDQAAVIPPGQDITRISDLISHQTVVPTGRTPP